MHISFLGTMLRCGVLALLLISTTPVAWSQDKMTTSLFKIITVKDDRLGGRDAGAVARALAAKGEMTVWQYGVRRGPSGDLQQAPTQKIGLLANNSLRVEPYTTPYTIVAHE